ncbi:MAG: cadherin-like domain-containing protein, partial [Cohnella sp.]|nr:cadherin-like domain-containing protein [Cohnella sp.]
YESKNLYSIRVRVTDSGGLTYEKVFEIHISNVNESPNADDVMGLSVNEDETLTGTLYGSDPEGDALIFILDTNAAQGNASVAPNGDFTYTPNANYSGTDEFRYKVYDGTTYSGAAAVYINVIPVSDAPTDITLSNATIAENSGVGYIIGSLDTLDPDAGDTFTYELVPGAGDDDNGSFILTDAILSTGVPVNYESKNLYSIRVRVTDSGGLTYEKVFEIHITDVDESVTNIAIENLALFDYTTISAAIGTLIPTGGEGGIAYSFAEGAGDEDNALFAINGNLLMTSAVYDNGLKGTYHIRVKATDSNNAEYEKSLTIATTRLLTYVQILSYQGADNVTSSVYLPEIAPAGYIKVSGHEYIAVMRSESSGYAFAMRADMNSPGTLSLNGTQVIPIGIWYQFGLSLGWNHLLASVPDGNGIPRDYILHVWIGDTPPTSLAMVDLFAEDDAENQLNTVADGTNPFLWRATVTDPTAPFVDISAGFADSGTMISKVVLANGQYAEEAGTMPNGFRIPFSGTPTYAYIHIVDVDGKPYVYKLIIEPMSS